MYNSDSTKNLEFDLDYTQKKFIKYNKVKLWNAFPKTLLGYPGKEFRYEYINEHKIAFKRIYIVKNLVYELTYEGSKEKAFQLEIDKYFNSLKLLNVPENIPRYLNLPNEDEIKNKPYNIDFLETPKLQLKFKKII